MYVVYVCMNVYMRVCMCTHVYVCMCRCMYVCVYIYNTYMCMYMYECVYVCLYVCACMYVYMYICMYIHVYECMWCNLNGNLWSVPSWYCFLMAAIYDIYRGCFFQSIEAIANSDIQFNIALHPLSDAILPLMLILCWIQKMHLWGSKGISRGSKSKSRFHLNQWRKKDTYDAFVSGNCLFA